MYSRCVREDGGTLLTDMGERQKKDFQFYTTVSTTLLPPSEYPIAQNLYSYANDVFIGLDITRSLLKIFHWVMDSLHMNIKINMDDQVIPCFFLQASFN